jgi:hypothetical protein
MAGAEGGRKAPWSRWAQAVVDAWRERASERRATAAPRSVRIGRVARWRVVSAVEARLAVRAGVRLDDFLRGRLAKYAASLPVTLEELPVAIDVEGGEAVVRSRSRSWASKPAPGATPALARELVAREGPYADREIRDAEAALDALDERAARARARIDDMAAALSDAIASGALAARPDVVATAEQLGRPTVPTLAPIAALRGFVAALLVGLGWRFAGPILAACGVHAASPEAAVAAAPVPAALALVLSLAAAAAALAFAGVALSRAADALDDAAPPRRRAALALAACASAAGTAGVAAAATSADRQLQLALLVALPFAGALLWRWSTRLQRVRAGALDAALAWDRDRTREGVERGRRIEALEAERAALAALEAERDRARRRLRALHRRAVDAERHAGFAARAEASRLDRLAEGLASALELDRYLYIRLAAERDTALLPRPARPTRVGAAVATDSLGMAG